MNYKQFEDILFAEWRKRSVANGDGNELAPDGLLYRGRFVYNDGYWSREPGNEDVIWERAKRRVLILTKDLNDEEAWDIRAETGRNNFSGENNVVVSAPFYKNLMRWVYGLLTIDANGHAKSFAEIDSQGVYQPFYDQAPVARVNCKKQVGKSSIETSVLKSYMERYKDLLVKQIAAYDANILLCCGASEAIKDFVAEHYLTDLVKLNNWVYYSPQTHKMVIDSWHPTYTGDTHEKMYSDMMKAIHEVWDRMKI